MSPESSAALEDLFRALRLQTAEYRELLRLAQRQTDLTVKRDLEGLREANLRQGEVLARLQELDTSAREALQRLQLSHSADWDRILADLPAATRREYETLRRALLDAALAVQQVNRRNAELLRNGLEYARYFLTALSQAPAGGVAYTASGRVQPASSPVAIYGLG